MSGDHLLQGYTPERPQTLSQGEPLWTLTKDNNVRVTVELLDQSRAGVELRMLLTRIESLDRSWVRA